ncbi:MAG: hypothetical protein ABJP02_10130 [Parasphingorhabdus sp.]|uniref:hypothetical protein n=1 Tax=Parasphingorhabdus sp. TaxID=2709688 RepID=UPI003263A55C
MLYFHRQVTLSRTARLKFAITPILAASMLISAKAEESLARKGEVSATTYASAQIHERFEVRSKNFAKPESHVDQNLPDISLRDCDAEIRHLIKNCVLMIYEIQ